LGKNTSSIERTDAFAAEELDVTEVEEEPDDTEDDELEAETLDEDKELDETIEDVEDWLVVTMLEVELVDKLVLEVVVVDWAPKEIAA
jgi:hypothetical protein